MASLAGIRGLVVGASSPPVSGDLRARALGWWGGVRAAFQTEADERRLFLWVPVLAGAGAILYLSADREPSLVYAAIVFALAVAIALAARAKPLAFRLAVAAAAVCGGIGILVAFAPHLWADWFSSDPEVLAKYVAGDATVAKELRGAIFVTEFEAIESEAVVDPDCQEQLRLDVGAIEDDLLIPCPLLLGEP